MRARKLIAGTTLAIIMISAGTSWTVFKWNMCRDAGYSVAACIIISGSR